jgi:hypothetical protein
MTITDSENNYIKLAFENGKPTPARYTKTLKSSWNFAPSTERKQTIATYPLMISGVLGSDSAMKGLSERLNVMSIDVMY